jgi:hypothetical protein
MSLRIHAIRALAAMSFLAGLATAAHAAQPAFSGKPVALEGTLDVLVEDYADGHSRTRHFLQTGHGRVEVKFAARATQLPSGTRVRVHGQAAQGEVLALDGTQVEALATVLPATMGEQRIAVLLVNFADNVVQPITAASANTLVFDSIDKYYREASFGQTWFKGQVFGYYTIAMSKTVCDPYGMASQAEAAAAAAGVDLSAFNRKVFLFPRNACTWAGLGNVGGSSTRAWANGSFATLTVGHELGHNYGLHHAHAYDCDVAPLGNTCASLAYGDAAGMMGNNKAGHFNPFEKEMLGWLNDGVSPPIHAATTSGRYAIEPYSSSSVGAKAIKIPRGTDANGHPSWYYLEYRQPIGADAVLTLGNLTKGVMVRIGSDGDGESGYQLDMSPGTSTSSYAELYDGALAVGQTYSDAGAKVSFTLVSADANGAIVDVSVGSASAPACTRTAPTLALTGPATAVAAGTTQSYTLTLTNNDSSACAATSFNLARSVPTGWTGTLAATTLSLSPGAKGSTTLTVASPATAGAGSYAVGAGTSSSIGSTHTASVAATYAVAASTGGTLSESVATDKASYLRGETVRMSALVKNNGVAVAGASVKFSVALPSGSTTVISATSGSDGYARASYRTAKGKGAAGAYGVRADVSASGGSASASTTFSVQ